MRGPDHKQNALFSYVNIEERIPTEHPLLCRGDREFGPPSADAVELGARLRRDDVAGCRPPGIRSRVA